MSGGSSDDAVLAIGHRDVDGRVILDALQDQGARPPFDPNAAVLRFVATLQQYRVSRVAGDKYAGELVRHIDPALIDRCLRAGVRTAHRPRF
jgi:hypothetical protein